MRWAVVVPTCRPEKYDDFLRAWEPLFNRHGVAVYAVRDEPASWETWPEWVPRQSDQCRSYGFWQAWRDGCDYTLSLDDDVRPLIGVDVFQEYEAAFDRGWPCTPYLSVGALTDSGREMRGFPYEGRQARCVVQYGGWDGVLDYDGKTQLDGAPLDSRFAETVIPVPRGVAVTTCAMNVAFRTEFTPCMWQLPVLQTEHEWGAESPDLDGRRCQKCGFTLTNAEFSRAGHVEPRTCGGRYKRWGDIWSGLIQKRVLDARGEVMLVNGRASVLHDRASDPVKNAAIEAPGMKTNDAVWDTLEENCRFEIRDFALAVALADLHGEPLDGQDDDYKIFSYWFAESFRDREYRNHFLRCRDEWLALFAEKPVAA